MNGQHELTGGGRYSTAIMCAGPWARRRCEFAEESEFAKDIVIGQTVALYAALVNTMGG